MSPASPVPTSSPPVGKRTEMFIRFSTVADSRGGADAARDPCGWP